MILWCIGLSYGIRLEDPGLRSDDSGVSVYRDCVRRKYEKTDLISLFGCSENAESRKTLEGVLMLQKVQ